MECYAHPGVAAIGACTVCGRAICQEDAVDVQGKLVCREDLARGRASQSAGKKYDPNTAFLPELIAGFLGLLGIGYIYAGRTNDGVIRLILWLAYGLTAACIIALLLTVVVGFVCIPVQLVIQIGVPLWSAYVLKGELESGAVGVPAVL
jgi:hypothetical protein